MPIPRLGRRGFIVVAVLFHLVYIYSIFDVYFVSPIVHGMEQYAVKNAEVPSKRLVLVVGDGLRADKCFEPHVDPISGDSSYLAPFLRSKVLKDGTFGVSHTRVPTESRPGHVAMIAGLYEDVSAVMTGWKLNPVNFDSVFNQSRQTWSWGSPDILPMFSEGASDVQRVVTYTYGEDAEDYTKDSILLDKFVFDGVREFFASAAKNETLKTMLQQDKLVFFLHLLGLDTAGHSYRPYSKEYLDNIKYVDAGVRQVNQIIEDFYGHDGKTSWVFTADHGMSDFGSHGDGHPDNTRTPLVVWGAGVAKPVKPSSSEDSGHDEYSEPWNLHSVQRHDVAQADVAALMSYLVGLNFPVNSVGQLPLDFLSASPKTKAEAVLANARQILEQYKVKRSRKMLHQLKYQPFESLDSTPNLIDDAFDEIRNLISSGDFEMSILRSSELIEAAFEGLRYLQTYDWLFLRAVITAGYIGWIFFALTTVLDLHVLDGTLQPSRNVATATSFGAAFVALSCIMLLQQSRWTYYAYAVFPFAFWEEVFARRQSLIQGVKRLTTHLRSPMSYLGLFVKTFASLQLLQAMVLGYFQREAFTVCWILAVFWPLLYGSKFVGRNKALIAMWTGICCIMSTFTLLPVVKQESSVLITTGGLLMFFTGFLYMISKSNGGSQPTIQAGLQLGLIVLSILVTRSSVQSLQAKQGLPLGNQVVGWLILVSSILVLFSGRGKENMSILDRLMTVFLSFSPTFIILTISYEGLFYVAFSAVLFAWVELEHRIQMHTRGQKAVAPLVTGQGYRPLTLGDTRIALFFFFLVQVAFFGTGNIASVSSFSLESVYRLIPVFDPFSMGALLIFKLLIPFAVISANLGVLTRRLGVAPSSLFMVVMALSDVLTLNFFYLVKDEGSWLEIGSTISHFVIVSLLGIFCAALELLSQVFASDLLADEEEKSEGQNRNTSPRSDGTKSSKGSEDQFNEGAGKGDLGPNGVMVGVDGCEKDRHDVRR